MRTGEEVNIGGVEWQSAVRRHASFCSQARRHRPLFSQRAPPLRVPVWVIPPYTPRFTGAIRPSSTHGSALDGSSLSLNHCLFFPFSLLIPLQSLFFQLSFLIMTSLAVSSSASSLHSASPLSFHTASSPPSPKPLATSSASSSQVSFSQADEGASLLPPTDSRRRTTSWLICLREYYNHSCSCIVKQWR